VQASSSSVSLSSTAGGNLAYLQVGQTFQYSATVTGANNTAVLWSVNGIPGGNATVGTISSSGLYTAPSAAPNPNTVTIGVVSAADSTRGESGTVTIYGPAATPSASSLSMGVVGIGSSVMQSMTLANSGGAALAIANASISGANSTDFSLLNVCTNVAVGFSCPITISFAPTAAGVRSAALVLTDNDPGGSQIIGLFGIGAAQGNVTTAATLSPNILNFGPVPLSSLSATQTVTLTNTGAVPLDVTSLAVGGLNAGDFTISDDTCPQDPATLAPGAGCTISLVFVPSLAAAESASLTISDNTSTGAQTIALAGSGSNSTAGPQPAVSLSSTLLNYGAVPAGTSALQTVTLINSGATTFDITGVTIAGPNAADFSVSSTTCPLDPYSLPIGGYCAITVAAKSSTFGTETAFVQIGSPSTSVAAGIRHPEDVITQQYFYIPAISLPRGGAAPPALTLNPSPVVNFGAVPLGTQAFRRIIISNPGVAPVFLWSTSIFTVGNGFAIVGNACPLNGMLAPNTGCIIIVSATQFTNPTQSGTLIVVSSAGISQTILLSSGPGPFTVGVLLAGLGSGNVNINPPNANCTSTPCPLYAYPQGTTVNLTATANHNSFFLGWSEVTGVCGGWLPSISSTAAGGTCGPFIMDDNKLIVATFPLRHEVLVVNPASIDFQAVGGVATPANIAVGVTEQSGLSATFRITPSVPWIVVNPASAAVGVTPATVTIEVNPLIMPVAVGVYSFAISFASSFATSTLVLNGTLTVTAPPSQFNLTVSNAGTGTGTVSLNPPGGTYAGGTAVTLTATPNTGSTFAGWSGACTGTGTCTLTMNANETVTATFNLASAQQFTLITSTSGTGSGTVSYSPAGTLCGSGCQSFAAGTVVTLTATANSGSTFAGWYSAACSGTGTCTVTMNGNQIVAATFNLASAQQFTLITSTSGTGSGTVTDSPAGTSCGPGCQSFAAGIVVTLTASPNSGSTFAGWYSAACSGTGTCTVTMNGNQIVAAIFNLQGATVTLTGVTLSTGSLVGGTPATGTVTLSGPAGSGGVSVALQSNTPSVAVPASVTVPVGQTSANFAISTSAVSVQTTATISASLNGTVKTATLTLTPVPAGGGPLTGTWTGTWTDTEPAPQSSCVLTTTLTWKLTQSGSTVTGTYSVLVTAGAPASFCSDSVGESITGNFVLGIVNGSSVTLTTDANLNGFVFSGTLAGTTITGTGGSANEGGPFSLTYH